VDNASLTLKEAASISGKSEVTLRRLVKSGQLKTEPRASERAAYKVTLKSLEAAGLAVTSQVSSQAENSGFYLSERLATLEAENATLSAENADLRERIGRAEGALKVWQEVAAPALATLSRLTETLSLNSQATSQVSSHPEEAETVSKRRAWWRRRRLGKAL